MRNVAAAVTGLRSSDALAVSPVHPVICSVRGVLSAESFFPIRTTTHKKMGKR